MSLSVVIITIHLQAAGFLGDEASLAELCQHTAA